MGWESGTTPTDLQFLDVALSGQTLTGPWVSEVFYTGSHPWLYVSYDQGPEDVGSVKFEFFRDQECTALLETDGFVVQPVGFFAGPMAVHGPWLRITVEANSYPVTATARIVLSPYPRHAMGFDAGAARMIGDGGTPSPRLVPPGTDQIFAPQTFRGWVNCYAQTPANGIILVEHVDAVGFNAMIYRLTASLRETVRLYLMPQPIRVSYTNSGGAAANFFFTMQGDYSSY